MKFQGHTSVSWQPDSEPDSGYNTFTDYSVYSLLIVNLVSIFLAFYEGWSLQDLLWIYWLQSAAIGLTNFWRMWTQKNFTTDQIKVSGSPVPLELFKIKLKYDSILSTFYRKL